MTRLIGIGILGLMSLATLLLFYSTVVSGADLVDRIGMFVTGSLMAFAVFAAFSEDQE